jgi:acylpyruvate hydrolase
VRPALDIKLVVDGETMQSDNTGDLPFDPVAMVARIEGIGSVRNRIVAS